MKDVEVDEQLKRAAMHERLRQDIAKARPRREYIRDALRNGSSPEYLALRYEIALEDILKAKAIWDRESAAPKVKESR